MSSDIVSVAMKNKPTDVVFEICQSMLRNSPEYSYKRLNPALRSTLDNCIEADLPFAADTFRRIFDELRGSWWFGDGNGSHKGEGFYTLACSVGHASAQQSFEAFAERPACLWEENSKSPFRLHVGARFTWKGRFVTVTSMRQNSLVACTYHDNRAIKERFIIPYTEIAELRKTAKARVRAIIKQIEEPACDLEAIKKAVNGGHFRHFELEEINAAVAKRAEKLKSAEKVSAWRSGENGAWLGTDEILLRVNGDRVECSNGNSIKKKTAQAVLPVILASRSKKAALNLQIDSYKVESIKRDGVQVGCTLVPWAEIDYLARELKVA